MTSPSPVRSVRIEVEARKKRRGVLASAAVLAICLPAALPIGAQAAPLDSANTAERPRDCTTEAKLSGKGPAVLNYVVWCGVQPGRVTLRIRRPKGPALLDFSQTAQAAGPGASGPLRCRPQSGGRVFCAGRKSGPATFRGSVTVAPETRCAAPVAGSR